MGLREPPRRAVGVGVASRGRAAGQGRAGRALIAAGRRRTAPSKRAEGPAGPLLPSRVSRLASHPVPSHPEAGAMLHWGYDEHNGTGVEAGGGGSRSCPGPPGDGVALRTRLRAGFAVRHRGADGAGAVFGSGRVPFCCTVPASASVVSHPRGDALGSGLFRASLHLSVLGIAEVRPAEGLMPLCSAP